MIEHEIHEGWKDLDALRDDWDRIFTSCSIDIRDPDATCSSVWARALSETLLLGAEVRTLSVSSESEVVGVLPMYLGQPSRTPFSRRDLRAITEAYSGRCGFLVLDRDASLIECMLERLISSVSGWDAFVFSVVEGSSSQAAVMEAVRKRSLRMDCLGESRSPFIELAGSWEQQLSTLPKKMRWTIRKSERDLRSKGQLEYEQFTDFASVDFLLESIRTVETNSWKEQSGTSITSQQAQQEFYVALAASAAQSGILSAHVLRLDSRPIAYILGLAAGDGVFLDLKESFDSSYSEFSPGHVLKRFAFESLIASNVSTYDFMGDCETYKMRWTDKTYRSLTYRLFRPTFRGSFYYWGARLAKGSALTGNG